jgi:hypothetical protein
VRRVSECGDPSTQLVCDGDANRFFAAGATDAVDSGLQTHLDFDGRRGRQLNRGTNVEGPGLGALWGQGAAGAGDVGPVDAGARSGGEVLAEVYGDGWHGRRLRILLRA